MPLARPRVRAVCAFRASSRTRAGLADQENTRRIGDRCFPVQKKKKKNFFFSSPRWVSKWNSDSRSPGADTFATSGSDRLLECGIWMTASRMNADELRRDGGILAPAVRAHLRAQPPRHPPVRRRLTAAAVAVALAVAPLPATPPAVSRAAAQSLPDLGDASQTDFSPAQERKLGETIIRQVRASGALHQRPRGQRLPERARSPARGRVEGRQAGLRVLRAFPIRRSTRSRCPAATSACTPGSSCSRRRNRSSRACSRTKSRTSRSITWRARSPRRRIRC